MKQVTAADIEIHDMEQNFNNLNKLDDGDRGEVGRTNSGFSRSNVLPVLEEEFSEHEEKREESPRKRKLGVAGIGMEKNRRESSFEMMVSCSLLSYLIYFIIFEGNCSMRNLHWDGQIAKKRQVLSSHKLKNFFFLLFSFMH